MLSKIPIDIEKMKGKDVDNEILRVGMIAELDAVSLYEQLAAVASNAKIRKILADIAKEEKTHVGEFEALLMQGDPEQAQELKKGRAEVEEKTK